MKAYTYLIGWSSMNKYYFGLRYKRGCKTTDLWTKYFTSSKQVKIMREFFGEPDIIQIRTMFDDISKAREHEHKILRRLQVLKNDKWLNNTTNKAFSNNNNASLFLDPVKKQKWYENVCKAARSDRKRAVARENNRKQFSDPEQAKKHKESCVPVWDFIWINDGVNNKRIPNNSELQEGWVRGRIIPDSQKLKMKESRGVIPRSPINGQFCNNEKVSLK